MLEKEFKYYLDHQSDLVKKFKGKFIVIVGEQVIDSFTTEAAAYLEMIKTREPGTFLIQLCEPGDSSYTEVYHSRVSFN